MISLSITAFGMVTAVGFNAPASLAAIRAGINGMDEVNLWDYETGKYLSGGKVGLPQWWEGIEKLADLVAPAIYECLVAAEPTPADQIPIMLGVAAPDRPIRTDQLDKRILEEISFRLETSLHPASAVIPRGRVSGVVGLCVSRRLLTEHGMSCCIVAGVDSFMHQNVAEVYMERRRLLTASNSNGFIPGEAGTAVLVQSGGSSESGQIHILGMGMARESATIDSEDPLRGDGLTKAVGNALAEAGLSIFDVSYRITDINGEHYKFKEAMLAAMRFEHGRSRKEIFDLWHPIECIGEVGAAIGPCVLALALHAGQYGYAPGGVVLCHFGNDDGERAAAVVKFEVGSTG